MSIDWSKAPDWAIAHALYAFGGEISEVWVGEFEYQRLDIPTEYPYGGGNGDARHNPRRSQFRYETPRPSAWSGEGLPPVGTVCEAMMSPLGSPNYEWRQVKVVHGGIPGAEKEALVFDLKTTRPAWADEFRPSRTPEQIAAEERSAGIKAIMDDYVYTVGPCTHKLAFSQAERIYDAGYRKQVAQ